MNIKLFSSMVALTLILLNMACSCGNTPYDEEHWINALSEKKPIECNPEKVAEFQEIYKSPGLTYIDDQSIYLYNSDDLTLIVYSRNDMKIMYTMGGRGEGPAEFRTIQGLHVYKDFIFFNDMGGKNSYFSKEGKLIKELKCPSNLIPCLPVGENYVTNEYTEWIENLPTSPFMEERIVLVGPNYKTKKVLFNKKLNLSTVYNSSSGKRELTLFPDFCHYKIYKDNIYLGYSCMEGFYFYVFNLNGKKLYEINRPYLKREIPILIKEALQKRQQNKNKNSERKLDIKFYQYYPSFCGFEVADERIYIFLYPETHEQRVLILDLYGKLLEVNLIPFDVRKLETNGFRVLSSNRIHNGMKYYLKDNLETEKWELWRLKIANPTKNASGS